VSFTHVNFQYINQVLGVNKSHQVNIHDVSYIIFILFEALNFLHVSLSKMILEYTCVKG
jgi:hypothetical protein